MLLNLFIRRIFCVDTYLNHNTSALYCNIRCKISYYYGGSAIIFKWPYLPKGPSVFKQRNYLSVENSGTRRKM